MLVARFLCGGLLASLACGQPIPYSPVVDLSDQVVQITDRGSGVVSTSVLAARANCADIVFDNMFPVGGDANEPVPNFAYLRAQPGGGFEGLCPPYLPQVPDAFVAFPTSSNACLGYPFPEPIAFPEVGYPFPFELIWDNYQVADFGPNELPDPFEVTQVGLAIAKYSPPEGFPYLLDLHLAFFELTDANNNGILDETGGVDIVLSFSGDEGAGVYQLQLSLEGSLATLPLAPKSGLYLLDTGDRLREPTTGADLGPACDFGTPMAGGNELCPADTLARAGTQATNFWLWGDGVLGDPNAMPPYEPNELVADLDGDPNRNAYFETLNGGLLFNLVFTEGLGGNNSYNRPLRLGAVRTQPCGNACRVGGAQPDLNGDCRVDLSDLSQVLASFGQPPDGDTNGDGQVDLTDLANVLARFGTECPPPSSCP